MSSPRNVRLGAGGDDCSSDGDSSETPDEAQAAAQEEMSIRHVAALRALRVRRASQGTRNEEELRARQSARGSFAAEPPGEEALALALRIGRLDRDLQSYVLRVVASLEDAAAAASTANTAAAGPTRRFSVPSLPAKQLELDDDEGGPCVPPVVLVARRHRKSAGAPGRLDAGSRSWRVTTC